MSYITFDYKHPGGHVETRLVKREKMDEQVDEKGEPLVRLPAGTRTTFRYADTKLKD